MAGNCFSVVLTLTLVQLVASVRITTDTSRAPDLAPFATRVRETLTNWYPYIRDLLRSPNYVEPNTIPIIFENCDGVAYAGSGRIVGCIKYYREHLDDVGSMIHELTHIIQNYKNCAGWLTEGIADWIRYFEYERYRMSEKPSRDDHYTNGYGVSAYFLEWIRQKIHISPNMIYWTNKDCREGTYNDSIWKRLTGKDLETLWNEMLNDEPIRLNTLRHC